VLTIEAAQADLNAFVDRGCHQPYIDTAKSLAGAGFKAWLKSLFS